jgi:hypothetical protein
MAANRPMIVGYTLAPGLAKVSPGVKDGHGQAKGNKTRDRAQAGKACSQAQIFSA